MLQTEGPRLKIAVIGSGISGLSAAWLLAKRHDVTLFEKEARLGGHSNTVEVETERGCIPVDTGFIVYTTVNYPNLTALFQHLDVRSKFSNMSFAVSLGGGAFEYAGNSVGSLLAQKRNLLRPRFWSMLRGILRFYGQAPRDLAWLAASNLSLGDYLRQRGFGADFARLHLLPMAGAIWSAPPKALLDYPAEAFVRFFDHHGLLKLRNRPEWRTVVGGSRTYVAKLAQSLAGRIRLQCGATEIKRGPEGVSVRDRSGRVETFDHVVIGTHADQALALLSDPSKQERVLLGAFHYSRNLAVLHSDARLMPKRKGAWSSWNYLGASEEAGTALCVTYWMNCLQGLDADRDLFVTLNPYREPRQGSLYRSEIYEHPVFDAEALRAQARLPELQGKRNTWFCGAYFGAGFHEDGLKSGLAVAEMLGGVERPWGGGAARHQPGLHAEPAIELVS